VFGHGSDVGGAVTVVEVDVVEVDVVEVDVVGGQALKLSFDGTLVTLV
jgi:hypothetical protein